MPNKRSLPWRIFRTLIRVLGGVAGAAVLYLLVAWVLSRISVPAEAARGEDVTIYVLSNGVHTDLVLPVRDSGVDWTSMTPYANTRGGDTTMQWIGMGWGDKGFYLETPTWDDLTARTALRAAFGLSTTAMHATFYKQPVVGPACKRLGLTREQYGRLVVYIRNSFACAIPGHSEHIVTDANYGDTDAFYEGTGRYTLLHTCNTWTNNALKACGQKACVWTPFQGPILAQCE